MRHAVVAFLLALGSLGLSWHTGAGEGVGRGVRAGRSDVVRPEQLLPSDSFLGWRYDGAESHMLQIRETAD